MNTTAPTTTTTTGGDNGSGSGAAPGVAKDAVLVKSAEMPEGSQQVEELDFDKLRGRPITAADLLGGMTHMGFQASAIGEAVRIINEMRAWRDPETGARTTIFLGYTSNLISSGLRGVLRYLVQHRHVSCIVTSAGGVEEDLIKCLGPTYISSFSAPGADLRTRGLNRIGNLVVPNSNYCAFEDWVVPILDRMLEEQEASRQLRRRRDASSSFSASSATTTTTAAAAAAAAPPNSHNNDDDDDGDGELHWTPSKVIHRLGREIADERSVYYWAWRNDIPVFCPALTDGSLGDMLYFHTFRSSPAQLRIDVVEDIRRINTLAVRAARTGMVILGGGVIKHHIANANLMRNGAEYAVYVNTGQEFDGSDAGARPDEAVSWGKIKKDAQAVKVYADATTCFPLIVANTFAKDDAQDYAATVGKKAEGLSEGVQP